ncbi:amino acid adenylation domain-containing protein [Amycolatopsis sp. NPDC051758]|uniref:amino acid adenylation domain-containing protein n=1 Tax=Amycolatopsis sp. NPDC051758 TaxID=3363935 RepID=UPI0037886E90
MTRSAAPETGLDLDYWTAVMEGADSRPLPPPAGAGRDVDAVPDTRVPGIESIGPAISLLAQECGLPVRAFLVAAHLRVLGSVTSAAEVVTAVVGSGAPGHLVPVRVDLRGRTWCDVAGEVVRLERWAAAQSVGYPRLAGRAPQSVIDSRVDVAEHPVRQDSAAGRDLTEFPLAVRFTVGARGEDIALDVRCDSARVHAGIARRLPGYYRTTLAAIVAEPHAVATAPDIRAPDEREAVRGWGTGPAVEVTGPEPVHAQVRRQVRQRPHSVAVLDVRGSLTYAELGRRVDDLVLRLRAHGVLPGHRVGVYVDRSADLVVGLLAVLAAGAAYVPLDPGFPLARLRFIASDAEVACLVTGPDAGPPPIDVPLVPVEDRGAGGGAPPDAVTGTDTAYVMYTSGSTGRPKGTVLEHRNLANFFLGMDHAIGLSEADRVLAQTSVAFDISVLELLWPLTRGASTVVCPARVVERLARGEDSLLSLVRRFRPTLVQATPSFFTAVVSEPDLLAALGGVRALLVGGELLPRGLAHELVTAVPGARVVNMYGPTETTVWSMTHDLRPGDTRGQSIPVGRPISRTTTRVVDGLGNEACLGVPGELWIGGAGVARGYFRRPELDRERFVPGAGGPEDRCYRTGDHVRWREDGVLEFLGRTDRQVKLRGHRVELDEVENVLSEHPRVEAAAVVVANHATRGDELVAFVRFRPENVEERFGSGWRDVWNARYRTEREGAFAGWTDSYARARIPDGEMRDWLGSTVERIRRLAPRRIVDVGAGSGLLLRGLDRGWEHYVAIDIASEALAMAEAALGTSTAGPGEVVFREGDARMLAELPDASADLVVLNSVIQYFPGRDYLARVIAEAVRVAGPSGAVFVGDVRDVRLLRHFHADVQVRRSPRLMPAAELRTLVDHHVRAEDELCVAPGFFHELPAHQDGFAARIECRADRAWTEMSRFRWDVTLFGPRHPAFPAAEAGLPVVQWPQPDEPALDALVSVADRARDGGGRKVTGVPNARLVRPRAALRALDDADPAATAWEVARSVWMVPTGHAVDPADVHRVARERDLDVHVRPAASGDPTELDITFR